MIRFNILILLLPVILFLSLTSCKEEVKSNAQEKSDGWEILTESPIVGIVAVNIDIIFFNENIGVSQGMSAIRKTTDGGKTWNLLHNFEKTSTSSLVFTKNNVLWSVGSTFNNEEKYKPIILTSKDKGVTWQQIIFDKKDSEKIDKKFTSFTGICFDPTGKSWIIGNGGIVEGLISEEKFEVTNIFFTKEELYSIACNDEGEVWAVGKEGAIYHFQNGWEQKEINKEYTFGKVKLIGNDIWLLGYKRFAKDNDLSGVLLKSQDKGKSWEDKTPVDTLSLNDLHLENGEGWLVGDEGSIYYSRNNGDVWRRVKSPTQNNLSNIYFLNKENIWISGANQTILKFKPN